MRFTADTPVAEIAAALPPSVRVFERYGIDFCCGGKTPLGVACQERNVQYDDVAAALEGTARGRDDDQRDWTREPLQLLADHIITTFHNPLREQLPHLQSVAERVRAAHADKAPDLLARLEAVLDDLTADLMEHMHKEEMVLFPAIRRIETGRQAGIPIQTPIAVMEQEHDRAGDLLATLRELTTGYAVPQWGCPTVRALSEGLHAVEREMHVHVHLENNVLFPRAIRAAERQLASKGA